MREIEVIEDGEGGATLFADGQPLRVGTGHGNVLYAEADGLFVPTFIPTNLDLSTPKARAVALICHALTHDFITSNEGVFAALKIEHGESA